MQAVKGLDEKQRFAVLRAFYSRHDASKTEEQVRKLAAQYKKAGKFVDLCRRLHDKYKEHPAGFLGTKAEL